MNQRYEMLRTWLADIASAPLHQLTVITADASFRRYYRAVLGNSTYVVMDAPPEKLDCRPFIAVAEAFSAMSLHVPRVHAADLNKGFLLLTDLGDQQYLDALNDTTADHLYADAMAVILRLQTANHRLLEELPVFDRAFLMRELAIFSEWFLPCCSPHRLSESQQQDLQWIFARLCDSALEQPQVWMHRDFHSRNLMVVEQNNPGVLDFQDSVRGPLSYDLVSLLKDCYIDWPEDRIGYWVDDYYQRLRRSASIDLPSVAVFRRWFDLMGVQRHLKALGLFVRLYRRDDKPAYLADIPRTLAYVRDSAERYRELAGLSRLLQSVEIDFDKK